MTKLIEINQVFLQDLMKKDSKLLKRIVKTSPLESLAYTQPSFIKNGIEYEFLDIKTKKLGGYYLSKNYFDQGNIQFYAICRTKKDTYELISFKSTDSIVVLFKNNIEIAKCNEIRKSYYWEILNCKDSLLGYVKRQGLVVRRDTLSIQFRGTNVSYPLYLTSDRSLNNFVGFLTCVFSFGYIKQNYIPDLILNGDIPNIKEPYLKDIIFLVCLLFRLYYFTLDYELSE